MTRRLALILGGSVIIALLGAGVYYSVRAAYGAYGDYYYVTADLPRAGQQVQLGTDVRVRGVDVGKVSDLQLVDRHARLTLQIDDDFEIPRTATATVTLKTLLGSKFVDLRFDPDDDAPNLADGDSIGQASVGPELEDALDDGTRVLEALDPQDVATVVTELARASNGHGEDVARGLDANARLSGTFARTLDPQVRALEDLRVLFGALDDKGGDMNALAQAVNQGAPVYASEGAARAMGDALERLVPFSEDLSDLLVYQRSDWDRMIDAGDEVMSVVAARPDGLSNFVHGLYRYVFKLGGSIGKNLLPDGSAGAGFTAFIGGNDQAEDIKQICTAIPIDTRPTVPLCRGGGGR
jgi:phospholipid/cholesterol/gamma-HCH transport system substrate-binding protein